MKYRGLYESIVTVMADDQIEEAVGGFGSHYSRGEKYAEIARDHEDDYKPRGGSSSQAHHVAIGGKIVVDRATNKPKVFNNSAHAKAYSSAVLKKSPGKRVAYGTADQFKSAAATGNFSKDEYEKHFGKLEESVEIAEGAYDLTDPKHPTWLKRYNAYLKANNAEHSALTLRGFRDNGGRPTAHGKATKTNEEVESLDEISRGLASRFIDRTKGDEKRQAGRNLALKKKWGNKEYGLEEPKVKATESVELTFEDYLTAAIEKYGIEEAVDIADAAFLNKDISIFSDN